MCETDSREKFTDKERQVAITLSWGEWISKNCKNFNTNLQEIVIISKQVKKAAMSLPECKIHDPMDVVEMDELYTFVKKF